MADVCRALGLVPAGGNYESVWGHIRRLGLDAEHLVARSTRIGDGLPPIDEIEVMAVVPAARSVADACHRLGGPISRRHGVAGAIR
jgi:hypothetical protein